MLRELTSRYDREARADGIEPTSDEPIRAARDAERAAPSSGEDGEGGEGETGEGEAGVEIDVEAPADREGTAPDAGLGLDAGDAGTP